MEDIARSSPCWLSQEKLMNNHLDPQSNPHNIAAGEWIEQ